MVSPFQSTPSPISHAAQIAPDWQSLRQMEIEEEKTIPDGDSE
jgi:hypothetical protein